MPDPFRGRGPQRVSHEVDDSATVSLVMTGSVDEVVAWVGWDWKRAARVIAIEQTRHKPRVKLLAVLYEVNDAARR
jgi:hypothetical protein